MRKWQREAVQHVYLILNSMPGGRGGTASADIRSVGKAIQCFNFVRHPMALVLDSIANGDAEEARERRAELDKAAAQCEELYKDRSPGEEGP